MPYIDDKDLLQLHKDAEKGQLLSDRLLDQIKYKNKELKGYRLQRNIFAGASVLLLLCILAFVSFSAGVSSSLAGNSHKNPTREASNVLVSLDSLEVVKMRLDNLKQQNQELSQLQEFYLAKQFLDKELVYSVQIKSFVENNVTLASKALTNTHFVKTNPFYSYSIGTFETLEEAQSFRKQLVSLGFDDAFVASYKDGKRVKIEPPY